MLQLALAHRASPLGNVWPEQEFPAARLARSSELGRCLLRSDQNVGQITNKVHAALQQTKYLLRHERIFTNKSHARRRPRGGMIMPVGTGGSIFCRAR
jgi:hypothetical protein